ncbi:MAG: ATP-dependent Clp protease ATP-binding subunit ClpX [Deltaproteobacteria bacterium]|nr:MAG: ATP-dependent Clp protease ATP-binding subunit ClpX [Deltaproteobacteria bacterium]
MGKYSNPGTLSCSFCNKSQKDVEKIIAGPNVYICSECIRLCLDIIRENTPQKPTAWGHSGVPAPARIKAFLDQYVVGQDQAKRKLAVAVYNHYKRLEANATPGESDVEVKKSNVLLIGPTGTGKTLLAQTLARFLDVPFVIADATTLTEAGYVGEDVESIVQQLYRAAKNNVERTVRGIIYLDEVDKVAKKNFTSSVSRDVSGEGVQQALLKLLEGTVTNIKPEGNKRLPNQDSVQIDTSDILFICGGSFEGLEKIIEQRIGRRSVGFQRDEASEAIDPKADRQALLRLTNTEDLEKFGLIPEFIGRIPVTAIMNPLDIEDLVHILTEPKNALIKQYQKLFKFEKVQLSFTDDAIGAIAEIARDRKAGARGLRATLESIMLDIMFEVPSIEGLTEVVITEEVVRHHRSPDYSVVKALGLSG